MLLFFIWYAVVRFALETFRSDNWTWFGIPTAMVVSTVFIVLAVLTLLWRHRPGHGTDPPPTFPAVATWGALGSPVEPSTPDESTADDSAPDDSTPDDPTDEVDASPR
jgi:hypothetical protein